MQPQQQACTNCNKQFSNDKIDLHEAYCLRNMRKCSQCQMFVDLRETEQHQETHHQKQPCQWCKAEYLPEELKGHLTACNRRPKNCQYCQTDVAYNQFDKHEAVCGARTRPCTICQLPTILRDLTTHENKCRERLLEAQRNPPPVERHVQRPNVVQRVRQRSPAIPQAIPRLHHMPSTREPREARQERPERDVSTNMLRHADSNHAGDRSLSSNRLNEKAVPKKTMKGYNGIIPPEHIKKVVDILPISVKLTIIKNKEKQQGRQPLRNRN